MIKHYQHQWFNSNIRNGNITDGLTARNSGTPSTDLVKVDATYTISGTGGYFCRRKNIK